ncbi:MAG TPA: hypothetical protein VGE38_16855 [Nocardioides sp.]|uniref:hypothetical protein n=1 Tax=Nocardioides sp. TaxID=35761 RepID=UPI002ED88A21
MSDIDLARVLAREDARRRAAALVPPGFKVLPDYPQWAWEPWREQMLWLWSLRAEKRRRDGQAGEREPESPEERLRTLLMRRDLQCYLRHRERQREACGALGLSWPPVQGSRRPFRWPWEVHVEGDPVVCPSDWSPLEEPARRGFRFAEEWRPGDVLVVPAERFAPPPAPEVDEESPVAEVDMADRVPSRDLLAAEGRPSPLLAERLSRELGRVSGSRYRGAVPPPTPVGSEGLDEYLGRGS